MLSNVNVCSLIAVLKVYLWDGTV